MSKFKDTSTTLGSFPSSIIKLGSQSPERKVSIILTWKLEILPQELETSQFLLTKEEKLRPKINPLFCHFRIRK